MALGPAVYDVFKGSLEVETKTLGFLSRVSVHDTGTFEDSIDAYRYTDSSSDSTGLFNQYIMSQFNDNLSYEMNDQGDFKEDYRLVYSKEGSDTATFSQSLTQFKDFSEEWSASVSIEFGAGVAISSEATFHDRQRLYYYWVPLSLVATFGQEVSLYSWLMTKEYTATFGEVVTVTQEKPHFFFKPSIASVDWSKI